MTICTPNSKPEQLQQLGTNLESTVATNKIYIMTRDVTTPRCDHTLLWPHPTVTTPKFQMPSREKYLYVELPTWIMALIRSWQ
jgi:hypothetical protein